MRIQMTTDGSCPGNGRTDETGRRGGIGGWAVLLESDHHHKAMSGFYDKYVTAPQMELSAILHGLQAIRVEEADIFVVTDSRMSIEWIEGIACAQNPIIGYLRDRIRSLVREKGFQLFFTHVKGHSGHQKNEQVDLLAGLAVKRWEKLRAFYEAPGNVPVDDDIAGFLLGCHSEAQVCYDDLRKEGLTTVDALFGIRNLVRPGQPWEELVSR